MTIRTAQMEDIDAITAVETECFPPAEAATKEDLQIGGDLMDTFVRNSYMGSFSGNDVYWEKPFFDYEV